MCKCIYTIYRKKNMCRFGFPRAKGPLIILIILIIFPQSTVNKHGIKFHPYWIHPTLKPNSGPQPCLFEALNRGFVGGPPFIHHVCQATNSVMILGKYMSYDSLWLKQRFGTSSKHRHRYHGGPPSRIFNSSTMQVEFTSKPSYRQWTHTPQMMSSFKKCWKGSMPSTCHSVSLFC